MFSVFCGNLGCFNSFVVLCFVLFMCCSLQVCFFSATLHSPQITQLAQQVCTNPTWVDLKGQDSVPDTVHHVLYRVHPERDARYCAEARHPACTDNMHSAPLKKSASDANWTNEERSQAVKEIKQHLLLKLIDAYDVS